MADRIVQTHRSTNEWRKKTHQTTYFSFEIEEPKLIGRQNCLNIISTIDLNHQKFEYLGATEQHSARHRRFACLTCRRSPEWNRLSLYFEWTRCYSPILFFCSIVFVLPNASKCSTFGPQMSFTRASEELKCRIHMNLSRPLFVRSKHTHRERTHASIKCDKIKWKKKNIRKRHAVLKITARHQQRASLFSSFPSFGFIRWIYSLAFFVSLAFWCH